MTNMSCNFVSFNVKYMFSVFFFLYLSMTNVYPTFYVFVNKKIVSCFFFYIYHWQSFVLLFKKNYLSHFWCISDKKLLRVFYLFISEKCSSYFLIHHWLTFVAYFLFIYRWQILILCCYVSVTDICPLFFLVVNDIFIVYFSMWQIFVPYFFFLWVKESKWKQKCLPQKQSRI